MMWILFLTSILHFLHVRAFWVVTWSPWTFNQVTLPYLPADQWPWNCSIILRPDRRPPRVKTETRHPQKPNQPAVATHLLVLVKRVDDQLHHTVDFSLEGMFFRLLSEFLDLGSVQSIQLDSLFLSEGDKWAQVRLVHIESTTGSMQMCAALLGISVHVQTVA